jgi:hypothetical protein
MTLTVKAPENPSPFTPSELANFFSSLAAATVADGQVRLQQGAGHFTNLVENPSLPISAGQRAEIKRLCAHPLMPKREKTLTFVAFLRDNQEQAAERIRKLQSLLSQLEDMRDAA